MKAPSVDCALQRYTNQLSSLETQLPRPSAETVLDVLVARDAVDTVLTDMRTYQLSAPKVHLSTKLFRLLNRRNSSAAHHTEITSNPTQYLSTVIQLDERLKQHETVIAQTVDLAKWRESRRPPEEAWWWYFDPPPQVHPWNRCNWLWNALSVTFLTISLSLVGDISSRFLVGGPDTLGTLAISTQGILTLLAGGSILTKAGQEANQRILTSLNIQKHYWHECNTVFSSLVLLSLISFRLSLPWIATFYNQWGVEAYQAGKLSAAEAKFNFERALKLNPDYAEPHYWLGNLYEHQTEFEQAKAEYRLAVQGDFLNAYNNLARLYIRDENPARAEELLRQGLHQIAAADLDPVEAKVLNYFIRKNLGWAMLQQEQYPEAKLRLQEADDLRQELEALKPELEALEFDSEALLIGMRATVHCLMAQAYEGNDNPEQALPEWQGCLQYGTEDHPDQRQWVDIARERSNKNKKPHKISNIANNT